MIFATDLDKTLIHSYRHLTDKKPVTVIEYKDTKPLSYMTDDAITLLNALKQEPNLTIIPVTARSNEQFQRISVVNDSEYAIIASGGKILHNNQPLPEWEKYVNDIINDNELFYHILIDVLNNYSKLMEVMPRTVDNAVIFFKINEPTENQPIFIDYISHICDNIDWNITIQGQKIYMAPHEISKENALNFLINHLNDDEIITAGDGKLDVNFIKMGTILKFIPSPSEALNYIENPEDYNLIYGGIDGTNNMLQQIINYTRKEH